MGFGIKVQIDGMDELTARLNSLDGQVGKKVLRKAVTRAAKIVSTEMRQHAPVLHTSSAARMKDYKALGTINVGILQQSIGVKIKSYRGRVMGFIGAREGFKQQIGQTRDGRPIYEDPANIAHLVEFGHGGPHPAPPHPFARPAWDAVKGQVNEVFRSTIEQGIQDAANQRSITKLLIKDIIQEVV